MISYQLMTTERESGEDYRNSGTPWSDIEQAIEFTNGIEHAAFLWQLVLLHDGRPEAVVATIDPEVEVDR